MFGVEHAQAAIRPQQDGGHVMIVHLAERGEDRRCEVASGMVVSSDPDLALAVEPADVGLVGTSLVMQSDRHGKPRPSGGVKKAYNARML